MWPSDNWYISTGRGYISLATADKKKDIINDKTYSIDNFNKLLRQNEDLENELREVKEINKNQEKMILEKTEVNDYRIDPLSCIKNPAKSRYEFTTVSGKPLHILLRWKNGNGIAFPSFQISW